MDRLQNADLSCTGRVQKQRNWLEQPLGVHSGYPMTMSQVVPVPGVQTPGDGVVVVVVFVAHGPSLSPCLRWAFTPALATVMVVSSGVPGS
jgi:hypothetical protein